MIAMVFVAMFAMQPGGELRQEYVTCLNNAVASAKTANVTADAFKAYAQKTCSTVEEGFKARLVTFNVKNGMSRKAATDDAQVQLEDYMYTYEEKFRYAGQPR